jgi:hypothetical protein
MERERLIRYLEIALYVLVAGFGSYGFYMAGKGQEAFLYWLREDGWAENLTVFFLVASSIIAIKRAVGYRRNKMGNAVFFWALLAFLFFFAAGEEISWGQKIFGIETPEFFMEKNYQQETNLHNLVVGDIKINKLIFSQLLFGVMAIYLVLLRPLSSKVSFIRKLVADFQVPLARWFYVVVLILLSIAFSEIKLLKKSELIEFVFSITFFLIFINPIFIQTKKKEAVPE